MVNETDDFVARLLFVLFVLFMAVIMAKVGG